MADAYIHRTLVNKLILFHNEVPHVPLCFRYDLGSWAAVVALRSPGITSGIASGITVEPSCGQGECREATRWIHGWPQLATSYQRPQQNYVALEWHLLRFIRLGRDGRAGATVLWSCGQGPGKVLELANNMSESVTRCWRQRDQADLPSRGAVSGTWPVQAPELSHLPKQRLSHTRVHAEDIMSRLGSRLVSSGSEIGISICLNNAGPVW